MSEADTPRIDADDAVMLPIQAELTLIICTQQNGHVVIFYLILSIKPLIYSGSEMTIVYYS